MVCYILFCYKSCVFGMIIKFLRLIIIQHLLRALSLGVCILFSYCIFTIKKAAISLSKQTRASSCHIVFVLVNAAQI
jgi:hypothetical protein